MITPMRCWPILLALLLSASSSFALERKLIGPAKAEKRVAGQNIRIIGCVRQPGVFAIAAPMPIREALKLAGGAHENPYDWTGTEFQPSAAMGNIVVFRQEGEYEVRYQVRLTRRGTPADHGFLIQPGDYIVVPETIF